MAGVDPTVCRTHSGGVKPASPRCSAASLRKRLRLSLIVVGFGVFLSLWGEAVPGNAGGVRHERETGINPMDNAPSRLIVGVPRHGTEDVSVTAALAGASDEAASAEATPTDGVKAQRGVVAMSARPARPKPSDPSQSPVSATLDRQPAYTAHTDSNPATKAEPSTAEGASVQQQRPASAVPATEPSAVDVTADASSQQKHFDRPRLGNVTPMDAALAQARALITQRRYARAATVLSPLFVTPPGTWEPWFWMGTTQLGLGQWEEARESFMGGLARDAAVPQLWVHCALVSQQQGRQGEALEFLRQAELLAPQLPEVQLNLAYSLEVQGAAPVAVEHYRMFLALTKDNNAYDGTREKVRRRLVRLAIREPL